MLKFSISCLLVLGSLFSLTVLAEELQSRLTVELMFPKKSTSAITAPPPASKPQELSGQVWLDVRPLPAKTEEGQYVIEYFLDGLLIHRAAGEFSYLLNTAGYEDGRHTLVVNFWDKSGPSAIGIREIIIHNLSEDE